MDMVHTHKIATLYEREEVVHLTTVIAMVKRHPRGVHAFTCKDGCLVFGGPINGMRVNSQWNAGGFACPNPCSQADLFKCGWLFADDPYLDHARLNSRIINTCLDLSDEEFSETRNRARRH